MSVKALAAVAVIGGLVGGGAAIGIQQLAAPHGIQGEAVRAYLLDHPEVIPEAMQRLQDREQGKAVAAIGGDLTKPFGSAYSGNPQGDVTLVEFYAIIAAIAGPACRCSSNWSRLIRNSASSIASCRSSRRRARRRRG